MPELGDEGGMAASHPCPAQGASGGAECIAKAGGLQGRRATVTHWIGPIRDIWGLCGSAGGGKAEGVDCKNVTGDV